MQDNRDGDGRWLKGGPSPNPGGLSRRQRTVVRLLEGLTPKAVRTLAALMDDPDAQVRLGAVKEVINRVAPAPPKAAAVAVNIAMNPSTAHLATLAAAAERRLAASRAADDATPVTATVVTFEQAPAG
jgi:hypothetical protein